PASYSMKTTTKEISVGIFMLAGLAAVAWLAISLGELDFLTRNQYTVQARFVSASGLKQGAFVEAAGVRIGKVKSIEFDPGNYLANVTLSIDSTVKIPEDAIASIRTSGIIGDKFVKITPGGSETMLQEGEEIFETEPSINLEELISKYIFESGDSK
ncbi:MAG: outer membrane lipid asymmetry maintenance protein MlaD, partial [Thiotrichales bacterium]|nr:outer membrane lipid asymmetry maintenance protein MlaD [Thiotrichales bacterium]